LRSAGRRIVSLSAAQTKLGRYYLKNKIQIIGLEIWLKWWSDKESWD
jgi:hypothetical protein